GLAYANGLQVERDREVVANGHQLLRESRAFNIVQQRFARPFLRELASVGNNLVQMPILLDQFTRGLLTDARHTRHIVRRIADHGEIIGHKMRKNTEPLAGVLHANPLFLDTSGSATSGIEQPYTGTYQLLEVLITGNNYDVHSRFDTLTRE